MLANTSSQSADHVAGKSVKFWNVDAVKTTCWSFNQNGEESSLKWLCTWLLVPDGLLIWASKNILKGEICGSSSGSSLNVCIMHQFDFFFLRVLSKWTQKIFVVPKCFRSVDSRFTQLTVKQSLFQLLLHKYIFFYTHSSAIHLFPSKIYYTLQRKKRNLTVFCFNTSNLQIKCARTSNIHIVHWS